MELESFTNEAMIRGYYVYKDIWEAVLDEEVPCQKELGNLADPFAVAVIRDGVVVGHVPKKISSVCSLFLQRNGSITCCVSGYRRFSEDLPQGGLEIPCTMTFVGEAKRTFKAKKLIESAFAGNLPPNKKRKVQVVEPELSGSQIWVRCSGIVLTTTDKDGIMNEVKLNDLMINMAQQLLRKQFPRITGLQSTLLQSKIHHAILTSKEHLQIIHSRGNHWIVASRIQAEDSVVRVYDSIYNTIDEGTQQVIKILFGQSFSLEIVPIEKQIGGRDCGLFAISISVALCLGLDPATLKFDQTLMRPHFVDCLENGHLSPFPTI